MLERPGPDADTPRMELWIPPGVVVVSIGLAMLLYRLKRRRWNAFARMARQLGMEHSRGDPFGLTSLAFDLFRMGDSRIAENVIWGDWHGTSVVLFDYWFYDQSGSGTRRWRSRTSTRFQCVITQADAACYPIVIERETVGSRIAGAFGSGEDVDFESEEFNRTFRVRSPNRRFAFELVDARMMDFLLSALTGYRFEALGRWLLVAGPRMQATEIVPLLGTAKEFRDRVPNVVRSLYGLAEAG